MGLCIIMLCAYKYFNNKWRAIRKMLSADVISQIGFIHKFRRKVCVDDHDLLTI